MKKYIFKLLKLLSVALIFSIVSCNNIQQETNIDNSSDTNINNETKVSPSDDNLAYISIGKITIGNQTARSSVVPDSNETLLSKLTNVMLQCIWESDSENPVTITGSNWTEFIAQFADPGYPLQTGTYSFTFNAKLDDVFFQATKNDDITAGTTKTLSFNLKPWNMTTNTEITTGGINITWNITGSPASATVTFADYTPQTFTSFTDNKLTYTKSGLAA